jgi:hypothetical protein
MKWSSENLLLFSALNWGEWLISLISRFIAGKGVPETPWIMDLVGPRARHFLRWCTSNPDHAGRSITDGGSCRFQKLGELWPQTLLTYHKCKGEERKERICLFVFQLMSQSSGYCCCCFAYIGFRSQISDRRPHMPTVVRRDFLQANSGNLKRGPGRFLPHPCCFTLHD